MEQFVKSLYDRTPDDKKKSILLMMHGAIYEMHNNGIVLGLSPEDAIRMHDPDPNVRVTRKTSLAKSVGRKFISLSLPLLLENGIGHFISVEYDARFVNSISLCIQGGIEGLYQAGVWQKNENSIMAYYISVADNGNDISPLVSNMTALNELYPDFVIKVVNQKDEKNSVSESKSSNGNENKPINKKGFFAKLFGK